MLTPTFYHSISGWWHNLVLKFPKIQVLKKSFECPNSWFSCWKMTPRFVFSQALISLSTHSALVGCCYASQIWNTPIYPVSHPCAPSPKAAVFRIGDYYGANTNRGHGGQTSSHPENNEFIIFKPVNFSNLSIFWIRVHRRPRPRTQSPLSLNCRPKKSFYRWLVRFSVKSSTTLSWELRKSWQTYGK